MEEGESEAGSSQGLSVLRRSAVLAEILKYYLSNYLFFR